MKNLPESLKLELLGILQEYTWKKSKQLDTNNLAKANFLYNIARDYPELPEHHKTWLNAVSSYASTGMEQAHNACKLYLESYAKNDDGNIQYFLAKSSDYLLSFDDAIEEYKKFAINNPKHRNSEKALERAIVLAEYNDQADDVIELSTIISRKTKRRSKKKRYIIKAAQYLQQNKRYKEAAKGLKKSLCSISYSKEKFKVNLMIASNLYRYDINAARSVLKDTIYRTSRKKKKIGTNSYKDLLAQKLICNYLRTRKSNI